MSLNVEAEKTAAHHTPGFLIDEAGIKTGIKAFCYFVMDYLSAGK